MPRYYLAHVWGCVEPSIQNPQDPVEDWDEFLAYARKFVQEEAPKRDEDIIFYLVETEDAGLTAGSFTDEQLYGEGEDVED